MAPVLRNHWLQGGIDGSLATGGAHTDNLTVPAGATLKKFLINNVAIYGRSDMTTWGTEPNPQVGITLTINNASYPNRIVYRTQRRIPFTSFTHYNVNALTTHYGQLFHCGDFELGVNQQMSYNGPGNPALTVSPALGINNVEVGMTAVTFRVQYSAWILYYL